MEAEGSVLGLLSAGDHIVSCDDIYGDTYRLFDRAVRRYQIETSYVSARSLAEYEQAVRPTTRMIWLETPTNPLLHLVDKGVSGRLQPDHACRGTHSLLILSKTPCADIARLDLIAPQSTIKEAVGVTVNVIAGNDVITCAEEAKDRPLGFHSRSKAHALFFAFPLSQTL